MEHPSMDTHHRSVLANDNPCHLLRTTRVRIYKKIYQSALRSSLLRIGKASAVMLSQPRRQYICVVPCKRPDTLALRVTVPDLHDAVPPSRHLQINNTRISRTIIRTFIISLYTSKTFFFLLFPL